MISDATRAERRKQQTYRAIVDATDLLLRTVGYSQITIRAIAEQADIGYGTFYLHFADKDEAVWAALEGWARYYMERLNMLLENEQHPRKEYLSWVMLFRFTYAYREGFLALFGQHGSSLLTRRYTDALARIHVENMLAERYTTKLNLPVDYLGQFIVGALMRLLVWWLEEMPPYSAEQLAAMLFETVYHRPPPDVADIDAWRL